jgi:hypothetical protein
MPRAGVASALLLAVALLVPSGASAVRVAAIRVGGPSAPGDSKVAIVSGPQALRGEGFGVYRGKRLVMSGRLRPAAGSPAPWRSAFRANLSPVHRPGNYFIRVGGRRSRPWRVSERPDRKLIPLLLKFFAANRDGAEPSPLHRSSHLNDATIRGGRYDGVRFDLTGGWMDAGDMLHFTQTTAYATMVLEAAAQLDPPQRVALSAEADVGIRWLLKAHPAPGLFVAQVGDNRDHQRGFSDPARDDRSRRRGIGHRLAYHWRRGIGGDVGGKVAAALAMAARRLPAADREALLGSAREWYRAGRRAGRATPPLRHAGNFYVVRDWRDSMAAAAVALFRATHERRFLRQARRYLRRVSPLHTLGYADVAPLAAAELCGRLGAPPVGPLPARREGCRFLRRNARRAVFYSRRNAFGPAGPMGWGTTSSSSAGGAVAALWGTRRGLATAAGARDYLLGRNPWGASFVVGIGPRSPRHISSWASVFGPAKPRGAVVGGPAPRQILRDQGFRPHGPLRRFNSRIAYEDARRDYVTSEPALDYGGNAILLLAALEAR